MGGQQSNVRIALPPKNRRCFPAYDNEAELYETAKEIQKCHLQAVKLASMIASMITTPGGPTGHFVFTTTATVLFTFLLHRASSSTDNDLEVCNHNNNSKTNKQGNSSTSLEDALIDSKVSASIAKKSVCELQAKLCVINNRLHRLEDSTISVEERRLEVVPALQMCEEVLQLFHDSTHVFRLNPLVSSPFLVPFAGVFVAVTELSLALIPTYKGQLVGEICLLRDTLSIYKKTCIQIRMKEIKLRRQQPGSMLDVVAGGMTADVNYIMVDAYLEANQRTVENSSELINETEEDMMDRIYQNANEAVVAYRNEVEEEYDKYFETALGAISKFSGFINNTSEHEWHQENTGESS